MTQSGTPGPPEDPPGRVRRTVAWSKATFGQRPNGHTGRGATMRRSTSASASPTATAAPRWCAQAGSPTGCSSGCLPSRSWPGVCLAFSTPTGRFRPRAPRRRRMVLGSDRQRRPFGRRERMVAAAGRWLAHPVDGVHMHESARPHARRDVAVKPPRVTRPIRAALVFNGLTSAPSRQWERAVGAGERLKRRRRGDATRDPRAVRILAVGVPAPPQPGARAGGSSCRGPLSSRSGSRRCTCSRCTSSVRS